MNGSSWGLIKPGWITCMRGGRGGRCLKGPSPFSPTPPNDLRNIGKAASQRGFFASQIRHSESRCIPPLVGGPRTGEGGARELLSIQAVGTLLRIVLQRRNTGLVRTLFLKKKIFLMKCAESHAAYARDHLKQK